jgi:hypothetical protein
MMKFVVSPRTEPLRSIVRVLAPLSAFRSVSVFVTVTLPERIPSRLPRCRSGGIRTLLNISSAPLSGWMRSRIVVEVLVTPQRNPVADCGTCYWNVQITCRDVQRIAGGVLASPCGAA